MESWRKYLFNEGMKQIEDLPDEAYISIRKNTGQKGNVYYEIKYADESGEDLKPSDISQPYGKVVIGSPGKEPCDGALQVDLAYASRGWGPLLYDVAMEYATEIANGLTAGRLSVSGAAREVWKYYLNKRDEVTAHQLDDVYNTLTRKGEDNCVQTSSRGRWGEDDYWEFSPLSKRYTKKREVMDILGDKLIL